MRKKYPDLTLMIRKTSILIEWAKVAEGGGSDGEEYLKLPEGRDSPERSVKRAMR